MSGRTFEARYSGRCAACPDGIEIGELLTYDEDDNVVHANCEHKNPILKAAEEVCPRCFLVKPLSGECGCDS